MQLGMAAVHLSKIQNIKPNIKLYVFVKRLNFFYFIRKFRNFQVNLDRIHLELILGLDVVILVVGELLNQVVDGAFAMNDVITSADVDGFARLLLLTNN